jgi:DNA-binding IclR family transcriptional regulator
MDIIEPSRVIRRRAQAMGLARVARTLGIPRATVGTYLAGVARPASAERIESRARALGWLAEGADDDMPPGAA